MPALALRQKHTIEAVIDRFKPREDIKQRLAESFETALKLGDGMASVQSLDDTPDQSGSTPPLLFSSKYSCPVCDYSLPELEPRLFSFNSPCLYTHLDVYKRQIRATERNELLATEADAAIAAIAGYDINFCFVYEFHGVYLSLMELVLQRLTGV